MLPQRMKKAVMDNPKKLATLIDLVNLPSTLREFVGHSQSSRLASIACMHLYIPSRWRAPRINEFVKRARAAKIHAFIISHLKKEMPAMMGKAKTQQKLIDNLEDVFAKVQREHHLPAGDFP